MIINLVNGFRNFINDFTVWMKSVPYRISEIEENGFGINRLIQNIFKEVGVDLKVKITFVGPKTVNSKI